MPGRMKPEAGRRRAKKKNKEQPAGASGFGRRFFSRQRDEEEFFKI